MVSIGATRTDEIIATVATITNLVAIGSCNSAVTKDSLIAIGASRSIPVSAITAQTVITHGRSGMPTTTNSSDIVIPHNVATTITGETVITYTPTAPFFTIGIFDQIVTIDRRVTIWADGQISVVETIITKLFIINSSAR
jgi:hypothetical protein